MFHPVEKRFESKLIFTEELLPNTYLWRKYNSISCSPNLLSAFYRRGAVEQVTGEYKALLCRKEYYDSNRCLSSFLRRQNSVELSIDITRR